MRLLVAFFISSVSTVPLLLLWTRHIEAASETQPDSKPARPSPASGTDRDKKAGRAVPGTNSAPTREQADFFETKIRPVLATRCYGCHSADAAKVKGGLRLDTRDGVRMGGDSGPAIVPGNPGESLLIRAMRYQDPALKMPPREKLSDVVVADFEAWVKMGAPDPRNQDGGTLMKAVDVERGRRFWSFQQPVLRAPPRVEGSTWPLSDIDRFVLAGLEARRMKPAGQADKRTLLRRVTYDLSGLPPTPEATEEFLRDDAPGAYERVVDRLLASPRFGERWGRHWLDVARYADTTGRTVNFNYPHAWRYRDYVIAAFNGDKPFDQFVKEQLAGDLMPTDDARARAERVVATGFLAVGPRALNEASDLQFELDVADEQIEATTLTFLGLTVACARCHDHKFDPITQRDYYALAGIFRSTETCYGTVRVITYRRPSPLIELPDDSGLPAGRGYLTFAERTRIEDNITELQNRTPDPVRRLFVDMLITLQKNKLESYRPDGTPRLLAMGVRDRPRDRLMDSPVYARGEIDKPGPAVPRGFVQVASEIKAPEIRNGSGRLALAYWIASESNPLTARVIVNRVWHHLFVRGIVPTGNDFGTTGQPPSNQGLLDHLAVNFIRDGWSIKRLIRRLVLSRSYQMSSTRSEEYFRSDPENALLWRMTPRRLDAESLRDSILAVSGLLDTTHPGATVITRQGEGPTNEPGLNVPLYRPSDDPAVNSRSVYLPVVRNNLYDFMTLFDAADPNMSVSERSTTTTPSQGLYLLNNALIHRAADAAADRIMHARADEEGRIRVAYAIFFARAPSERESRDAIRFLGEFHRTAENQGKPNAGRAAWAALCHALFLTTEFQYRE